MTQRAFYVSAPGAGPWRPASVTDLANVLEEEQSMPDGTVSWAGRVYDLSDVVDLVDLTAALADADDANERLQVDIALAVAEERRLTADVQAAEYEQQIAQHDLAIASAPQRAQEAQMRARDAELQQIKDHHRRNYPG